MRHDLIKRLNAEKQTKNETAPKEEGVPTMNLCRCEGCGKFLIDEGAEGYHIVTEGPMDVDGDPYPVQAQCGPVNCVDRDVIHFIKQLEGQIKFLTPIPSGRVSDW